MIWGNAAVIAIIPLDGGVMIVVVLSVGGRVGSSVSAVIYCRVCVGVNRLC